VAAGRFIVTTGRSGSTLMSQLLREHPAVLSLSEFFAMLHAPSLRAFPSQPLTGDEFWALLSTPRQEIVSIVRQCAGPMDPEALQRQLGTPPLLMMALPLLTNDPVAVHEEVGSYVRGLPRADSGSQYSRLFDWLCQRFNRQVWVERSGGSTGFLPELLKRWPEGRYLHLVRDGRSVTLSMAPRRGFRLAAAAGGLDVLDRSGASAEDLIAAAVARSGTEAVALERLGAMWAQEVVATDERLRALPPDQVLQLRYEDLVDDPARELGHLVEFFGIAELTPQTWLRWAAGQVQDRQQPWRELPEPDRSRLEAACSPGLRVFGYPVASGMSG
jgi:sulfotransferase family protein